MFTFFGGEYSKLAIDSVRITIFIAHKLSSFFKTMLVIVEDFLHDELAPIFAITNKNILQSNVYVVTSSYYS